MFDDLHKSRARAAIVARALAFALVPARAVASQTFWFAPQDPVATKQTGPADYLDLFAPDAPWQRRAGRLSVFEVSAQFVLSGSDDMLRTVFNEMKRRHVKMAVEMEHRRPIELAETPDAGATGDRGRHGNRPPRTRSRPDGAGRAMNSRATRHGSESIFADDDRHTIALA